MCLLGLAMLSGFGDSGRRVSPLPVLPPPPLKAQPMPKSADLVPRMDKRQRSHDRDARAWRRFLTQKISVSRCYIALATRPII